MLVSQRQTNLAIGYSNRGGVLHWVQPQALSQGPTGQASQSLPENIEMKNVDVCWALLHKKFIVKNQLKTYLTVAYL
jgi:hypothetical protein